MRWNNVIASDRLNFLLLFFFVQLKQYHEPSSARETPVPAQSSSSSSCFEDIQNQNHLPASSGPSSYGGPAVASYFNNGGGHGVADFFTMEPQVARPDVPQMEASVHSINRISDGIGQLIANASANLGPQNTILELESEKERAKAGE
ncbi:hypothetical protein pipiens_002486 [Culex pipiens pipiens]|uniref:Uncharacterized protein n=1 Tax=Culex pipiens pipiens TaxID=38569 RepID=A0ABD1DDH9_CULPP